MLNRRRMQRPIASDQKPALPGVIDTIADGFTAVVYQPLFLLPIFALEFYYWLGWSIELQGLGNRVASRLTGTSDAVHDLARAAHNAGGSDVTKLISLVVPGLLSDANGHEVYRLHDRPQLVAGNPLIGVLALVAAVAIATLLLAIYSVPLADAATGRVRSARTLPLAIVRTWGRLSALTGTLLVMLCLVAAPLIAGWVVFSTQGVDISPVVAAVASVLAFGAFFLLWFAPEAVVVAEAGPATAMRLSVRVVRENPRESFALIAASTVIAFGLGEIWLRMMATAPGLLLAIIGNAFFGTGLAFASMKFFADRARDLTPAAGHVPGDTNSTP